MLSMDIHQLNILDYSIIAVIGISILIGLVLGFVRMTMIVITWVAAITLGILYYEKVSTLFTMISVQGARYFIAFVLIVLATLIVGGVIGYIIGQLIRATSFSILDRMIGIVFGFGVGAFIVAAAILAASQSFIAQESFWKTSQLVPQFDPLSTWIKTLLPADFMEKVFSPAQKTHAKELVKEAETLTQKGITEGANALQNALDEHTKANSSKSNPNANPNSSSSSSSDSNPNSINNKQHPVHPHSSNTPSNTPSNAPANTPSHSTAPSSGSPTNEGYQGIQIDVSPEAIPRETIQPVR